LNIDRLLRDVESRLADWDEPERLELMDVLREAFARERRSLDPSFTVERERARFSAWYEFFPRSAARDGVRHGSFADCEAWLPYVQRMGFDVLYFPPIHPVGRERRKGRNNTLDPEATPPSGFPEYCSICGWALAQAHAKSGDPAAIAGYLGKSNVLDEALTRFAFAYAEQNDRDYDTLKRAAKSKRIKVAEWAS